jgi:hypothetical protein
MSSTASPFGFHDEVPPEPAQHPLDDDVDVRERAGPRR